MRTRMLQTVLSLFTLFCALPSCAPISDVDGDGIEEVATEDSALGAEELTAYSNSTFYVVTGPDVRRCAYPFCGGLYIKRVNLTTTVCSDGIAQPQCRALEFDYTALRLDAASEDRLKGLVFKGQALLRGTITKTAPIAGRTWDKFVALEAWEARTLGTPSGTFARVRQLPLACPACPPYRSEHLNRTVVQSMHKLGFDPARFSATLVKELETTLASSDSGILTAGQRSLSGTTATWNVSEAYTPWKGGAAGKVGDPCGSRGLPATCEAGAFCKFDRAAICGRVDGGGVCTRVPDACIKIYKPVCGCDRVTYGNECEASSASVSVDYDGPCS